MKNFHMGSLFRGQITRFRSRLRAMSEATAKTIFLTAVGSAAGAALYHFVVYPFLVKHLTNNG